MVEARREPRLPHEASGHLVLRVQDQATGELVEQIPADALLRLYAALRESLVDEQA